jgi:hypothetical protein
LMLHWRVKASPSTRRELANHPLSNQHLSLAGERGACFCVREREGGVKIRQRVWTGKK